ncbi:hypothetical protein QR98_0087780 [Sarcoptes scabiei]|uniref:Uncharacterized protein n=1 Tax=Sarcoptes scabiei TaxID=52283 RepID=A0A132AH19_SARSC|nr:hypothetical protein QR98_0087780 [Sarcoptes scabiei]
MASSASPSSTTAPASMSDRDSNALGGLFQNIITDLRLLLFGVCNRTEKVVSIFDISDDWRREIN